MDNVSTEILIITHAPPQLCTTPNRPLRSNPERPLRPLFNIHEIRNTKYEIFIASCTDKKYMETTMQQRAKDNIYD